MKNTLLHVSVLTAIIGMAAGCATRGNLDEVRATAETALSEARAAREAAEGGGAAMSTAQEAKSAADAAQACCNENTTRLDRMFEKAMRK